MLHGIYSAGKVVEESVCRNTEDYQFGNVGVYRIHSTSLMPNIPFEWSSIEPKEIDDSIFINDEETKLDFETSIKCQNFLSTRYVGRAPLEYYTEGVYTKMGREFILVCRGGDPKEEYRIFGTDNAVRGYNPNANENIAMPSDGCCSTGGS